MVRDPVIDPEPPASEPSKAMAGIAAALPIALSMGCCLLVPLIGAGGPGNVTALAEEMGPSFFLIMLTAPLAGVLAAVLIGLAGLGKRVPTAFALFAGVLPWLVGLAGHRYGMYMVESALAYADASSRASMIAKGYAESSGALLYGAGVASGVLLGISLGLAIAALGQRAPKRSFLGAALALLALPFLAASAWLVTVSPMVASTPIAIALGVIVAVGLGGAAVGEDAPRHRSAALSVGAVAAGTLAFVAAGSAAAIAAKMEVFSALAMVSAEGRMGILAAAAQELAPATTVARWGIALGVLPLLAAIGWAAVRSKLSAGMIAGGVASALVLGLVLGLDAYIAGVAPSGLADLARAPWHEHPEFEPGPLMAFTDDMEASPSVDALVVNGNLVPLSGDGPVPIGAGQGALTERLRTLLAASGAPAPDDFPPAPAPGVLGMLQQLEGSETIPSPSPSVGIAFDRRTDYATLTRVIEAATDAGAKSIWWTGAPGDVSAEERTRITEEFPLLGALLDQPSSVRVRLPASLPDTFVAIDPQYYRGTIEPGATELTLVSRSPSEHGPVRLAQDEYDRVYFSEDPIAYLHIGDGASASDVSRIVGYASNRGFTPVLYVGELPPPSPLGELGGILGEAAALEGLLGDDGSGTIGLGNLGTIGHGRPEGFGHSGPAEGSQAPTPPPRVRTGNADVVGSLSPEVIRRVIRRHVNEARFCYERELATHPSLTGRVTVSFVISASGSIASAEVQSSTLGNAEVESCLVSAVRRWTFPAPEGGGIVRVNYPFQFDAG